MHIVMIPFFTASTNRISASLSPKAGLSTIPIQVPFAQQENGVCGLIALAKLSALPRKQMSYPRIIRIMPYCASSLYPGCVKGLLSTLEIGTSLAKDCFK